MNGNAPTKRTTVSGWKSGQRPDKGLADVTSRSKCWRREAMKYPSSSRSVGLRLVLPSRHSDMGASPPPLKEFVPPEINIHAALSRYLIASIDWPTQSPQCKRRHRQSPQTTACGSFPWPIGKLAGGKQKVSTIKELPGLPTGFSP